MQHDMFIVIGFRDIESLTVIHPDSQHTVVSGPLEALVEQIAEKFSGLSRSVIKESPDVALSVHRAIKAVDPVERETLLAGLKIFKPKRDLGLAGSNTKLLILRQERQEDIGIGVWSWVKLLLPFPAVAPKSG